MEKMSNKLKKISRIFSQKKHGTNSIYKLFFGEENTVQQGHAMALIARYAKHAIQKEQNLLCTKSLR
jgi:hypothetical protein